ncbi:hypothetical protein [Liberibacter crescens]|uniref:hypothetical protein n=1 Tax=Liberibacter crescens TaxID=1273132 RepID=UPI0007632EC8|nr:hypothetical protein [Liberibacter crescens]AMC13182.1 hypothetical protein RL73_06305 [Liberibacter crescens]
MALKPHISKYADYRKNKKTKLLKPFIHVLQEMIIFLSVMKQKQKLKLLTRELINAWLAHSSRSWRLSQPKSYLRLHVTSPNNHHIPVYIFIKK